MLDIKYISDDIIEVKETIMSFTKDKISYTYYDIVNWVSYAHNNSKEQLTAEIIKSNPTPDNKYHYSHKMVDWKIEWVKKWFIPKAEKNKCLK